MWQKSLIAQRGAESPLTLAPVTLSLARIEILEDKWGFFFTSLLAYPANFRVDAQKLHLAKLCVYFEPQLTPLPLFDCRLVQETRLRSFKSVIRGPEFFQSDLDNTLVAGIRS
ncbi:hypothetical protein CRM22_003169 [Opisthorchis felineus]|uniref:Uncharacterized protein n=1 Tax=Opisthorchis felineus TaxID=147828 RepID=A0A4S2M2J6_OPIFE|nr:hypothetical protein CRM22_003169 [Opisthorchis felineus]